MATCSVCGGAMLTERPHRHPSDLRAAVESDHRDHGQDFVFEGCDECADEAEYPTDAERAATVPPSDPPGCTCDWDASMPLRHRSGCPDPPSDLRAAVERRAHDPLNCNGPHVELGAVLDLIPEGAVLVTESALAEALHDSEYHPCTGDAPSCMALGGRTPTWEQEAAAIIARLRGEK